MKKEKERREQEARDEEAIPDEEFVKSQTSSAAMGGGDDELFDKKLSKDEKKALAKAKREAKKKAKRKAKGEDSDDDGDATGGKGPSAQEVLLAAQAGISSAAAANSDCVAADLLASEGTICTFATSRKGVDARSRDINVQNFTLQHKGNVMLDGAEIVLNHGNRYGLIGRNGCGKSTLMRALGARAVPIPKGIDIFHVEEEIEPSDTVTALEAVMSVDEERNRLEIEAENLNSALATLTDDDGDGNANPDDEEQLTQDEQQEQIMELLNYVYERLDALDADTAETRARGILKGLGFTHEMQSKLTRDFSGGWRMRVSLARALFIQPILLLLDEPTNHLDMEAVIWLEDYLSKWDKILLLISHSQDFLNNVCSHMLHFTNVKSLVYYDGNYDQYIKTKSEKDENQAKRYDWEQDQIKSMRDYIAKFGHGTAKNAKQAQSKEKVLEKMMRSGLTPRPDREKLMNFCFPDPGHLPPPVLAFHDVSFAYPGCEPLYSGVDFGVDLDSRVALVGPNGAGKTTLVKLMSDELQPTSGDIRPHGHLKLGRFTQHFIDVLDLADTPLGFFEKEYPTDTREDMRKYLGRFGISGKMQMQKMEELSDGQKSRVVFAKLGREVPHILLLDEPTNHLDMESIDSLAKAVNEFEGGLVLVSHDMRLISQVAKEIWICDDKTVTKYRGDIQNFKMDMRAQMGISGKQTGNLRGDASVIQAGKDGEKVVKKKIPKRSGVTIISSTSSKTPTVVEPPLKVLNEESKGGDLWDTDEISDTPNAPATSHVNATPSVPPASNINATSSVSTTSTPNLNPNRYIPPHLRNKK